MIKFLKFVMFFITAIWGMLLGVFIPISMLILMNDPDFPDLFPVTVPPFVPVLWLFASIVGFVVPCFLVRFRKNKPAVALVIAGAAAILIVHFNLMRNSWSYLPLLAEAVVVIIIAVVTHNKERDIRENAPSPSILGESRDSDRHNRHGQASKNNKTKGKK